MIRNQKGFALVMTMSLLPVIIAGFFLAWAATGFIQQDLALKYACRSEGISGQKQVAPLLKKLLSLNPEAQRLKLALDNVNIKIKAALLTGNVAAVKVLQIKKLAIEAKRLTLDIRQRGLVLESNRALLAFHSRGRSNLKRTATDTSSLFIKLNLHGISGRAPRLAVHPDYSDIAPTYSPVADFASEQALAHEWQYTAMIERPFSGFLPGRFEFKKACAVTLTKELSEWVPQITKGRFSSRSVW